MIIQNFTFDNAYPSRQRRVYTDDASTVFYGTFEVLENGLPYNGIVKITKNGVEISPEDGTSRYSLNKLASDPRFNTFNLYANGVRHELVVEYAEGIALTDEGAGGTGPATGVQTVNGVEPDAEGDVLVEEISYESAGGQRITVKASDLKTDFFLTPAGGAHLQDTPPPDRTAVTMASLPGVLSANTLTLKDENNQTIGVYSPSDPATITLSSATSQGALPKKSGVGPQIEWSQMHELVVSSTNADSESELTFGPGGQGFISGIKISGKNGAMPVVVIKKDQMLVTGNDYQTKTVSYPNATGKMLVDSEIGTLSVTSQGQLVGTYNPLSGDQTLTLPEAGGSAPTPKDLPEYLYEIEFNSSYKEYGDAWRQEHFNEIEMGGCTGRSFNEGVKRWYDWKYDDSAVFVIRTPHRMDDEGEELYASVGVASLGSFLTKEMVQSGQHFEIYKALPGMMQDGLNEHGVYAQINVVKSDPTKDAGWTGSELDVLGAVRYVLDHFDKGSDAAQWIASSCYLPEGFVEATGYSVQFLIRGKDDDGDDYVYIVQDGIVHEITSFNMSLTNFRIFDPDGNSHTSREDVAVYDPYGSGIERRAIAVSSVSWDDDTDELNFTKAYTDNAYGTDSPWYSDFVGGDLDLNSPDEDFEDIMTTAQEAYENRTRDGQTWQTVHLSKYDFENKTLRVYVQEGIEPSDFTMPVAAGGGISQAEVQQMIDDAVDPLQSDIDDLDEEMPRQTITLSGTYSDETGFEFEVFIKPDAE